MESKIDEIREHIHEIKLDLKEHMSRTRVNEESLDLLKGELRPISKAYVGIKWSISAIIVSGMLISAALKIQGVL